MQGMPCVDWSDSSSIFRLNFRVNLEKQDKDWGGVCVCVHITDGNPVKTGR